MNNFCFKPFKVVIFLYLTSYLNIAIGLTADEIVYETTQEIINQLETDRDRLKAEPEYIQEIVRELVIPHLDFNTMSALTMGHNWDILNDDIHHCFSHGFKNLLVERYADVLLGYRNQDIDYQPAKPIGEQGYVAVIQTLSRPEVKPSTIEYRMRPTENSWKVVDLVIDEVSLIRNYRKMFKKEIKNLGLTDFIFSFSECKR
jgi:phospholipid transport system substrate-binding protein